MSHNMSRSVLLAIGLASGCKGCEEQQDIALMPCLSIAPAKDTAETMGPCLEYMPEPEDPAPDPCLTVLPEPPPPSPTPPTPTDNETGSIHEVRQRVLARGVLPEDIAKQLLT